MGESKGQGMGENEVRQAAEMTRFLDFGPFRLDRRERLLFSGGVAVALPPNGVALLVALTAEPGKLLSKEELISRVWPDVVVDESNLAQNIFLLRKALNDDGGRWIATVPRRGYRFVGEVSTGSGLAAGGVAPVLQPSRSIPDLADPLSAVTLTSDTRAADETGPRVPLAPPGSPRSTGHRWFRGGRMLAVLLPLAIALAVLWVVRRGVHDTTQPANSPIRSVAVLPFQPIDARETDRSLQLGRADTLINKLSQLSEVVVTPTHSVTPYLDARVDTLAAGRELGVDAVVEGNIQREGRRIRSSVPFL